jgi:branched-chain amino acid transport system ATP-binding protein
MLEIDDLHVSRGGSRILFGVSLEVRAREIVALVGRNGMGKTTLLRSIFGLTEVERGAIRFGGKDVVGLPSHRVARAGVGLVPEGRGMFPGLTVFENLQMGAGPRTQSMPDALDRVHAYFPLLRERAAQKAGTLSGGQQQLVAIARALIGSPELLVIDEFSDGIQPSIVQEIAAILQQINADGTAVLVVEQNARLALRLAHRAYVLEKGRVVAEGDGDALLADEASLQRLLVV